MTQVVAVLRSTHAPPHALLTRPQQRHPVAHGTYRQRGLQSRGTNVRIVIQSINYARLM